MYHLNATTGALELVTDKTKYPEVIYYFNYNFYDSPEALAAAGTAISATDMKVQAKQFKKSDDGNYHCYYVYWIRHEDNHDNNKMGVMEFAIVRNNLYQMLVTNITGLGDTDITIDPDKPDEGETYLKVKLNVKPWILRDINIIL